jgi:hypothetical protein
MILNRGLGFLVGLFLIPVLLIVGLLVIILAVTLPFVCFLRPDIIKIGGEK